MEARSHELPPKTPWNQSLIPACPTKTFDSRLADTDIGTSAGIMQDPA